MIAMKPLATRLYQAWQTAIAQDRILTEFEATQDDRAGRWRRGDRILYGLQLQAGEPTYYARNLTQGCEIISAIVEKSVGPYFCQLNGYRALRPGGGDRPVGRQPDIPAAAGQCRFHCQGATHPLSLLRREPLLQVQLPHFTWNAYHNAAPLEKAGHFLWVPTGAPQAPRDLPHWPQQLSAALLADALALFEQLTDTILFFNALHAGASVNHIHFQGVYQRQPLPIEAAAVEEYRGVPLVADYPVQAIAYPRHTAVDRIFACLDWLQIQGIPFNLALLSDRVIIVPRQADHEIVAEFPGDSLAALGMCGALKTIDQHAYDRVDAATINRALNKMVLPGRQVVDAWLATSPV
jgi:hypothetical protein